VTNGICSSRPTQSGSRTSRSLSASVCCMLPALRPTRRPMGEVCSGT
jgi:hypothetical protein